MAIAYIIARMDGTDYQAPSINWEQSPHRKFVTAENVERIRAAINIEDVATLHTEATWPFRVFSIEGVPTSRDGNFLTFDEVAIHSEEGDSWEAFGPYGDVVVGMVEKTARLGRSFHQEMKEKAQNRPALLTLDFPWFSLEESRNALDHVAEHTYLEGTARAVRHLVETSLPAEMEPEVVRMVMDAVLATALADLLRVGHNDVLTSAWKGVFGELPV